MRRGDIWYADLEPVLGSEANKRRPVVIVSNDGANRRATDLKRGVVTVVPLTSSVAHVYPFQTLLPPESTGLSRTSKAQAEQVRALDVSRLSGQAGRVDAPSLKRIDEALRLHLSL